MSTLPLTVEEIQALRKENRANLMRMFQERNPDIPYMPVHLMVEPTNTCNAKCPLCPTGVGELNRAKTFIKPGLFQTYIDQAFPYAETLNLWNFGEPFLHKGAFDFIRYARDRHMTVTVSTNGFVFYDTSNIDKLIDSGLSFLIVALDGATPEVFNQYRVNVHFDKVVEGLALLRDAKKRRGVDHPVVDVQFIVMSHNQHQVEAVSKIAKEAGGLFSVKTADFGMVDRLPDNISVPEKTEQSRYERSPEGELVLRVPRQNHCFYLWHMVLLNSNGEVIPCAYDIKSELVLGDLNRQPLREIWNGERARTIRQGVLEIRKQFKSCSTCTVDAWDIMYLRKPDTQEIRDNRALYRPGLATST